MKIFIVGSGKLAKALLTQLSLQDCEVVPWTPHFETLSERAIVVHAGSGRQLRECIVFCTKTKSVFIELATGLETEKMTPDFPLIVCSNTSVLVLKTLAMLKSNGNYFQDYEISITESHQSTKKTEPGTAFSLANSLKFPVSRINSIRDPEIQRNEIGIPQEFLDKHAYHKIVIKDSNDEITIQTKVLGHDSYVRGVKRVIETVLKNNFENRLYSILELVENGML